ncbi:LCP family protein [Sporolactobacillus nakayamae]|uniref:Transcriptional attenuator, LytR family n=1 Tax=Sporolactobacillus nakayamae TaxID=269670 RepID=A0A1I2STI8_9BACL|nr:LCP family protein [Sporolactobacillus nakayamae]SFG55863.1 transcriptional attenuator, LytR family [Sporolactobacillus nakayamae]
MVKKNETEKSRSTFRKSRRRHRVLRYVLLTLAFLLVAGTAYGFFEYHKLKPANHFNNLQAVGSTKNNSKVKNYKEKAGVFNVLLIGSDARKGNTASHTDSMVLIHADLNNHTYNMLSIPRDTRVYMQGYGHTKLTSVQYISQVKHGTKKGIVDAVTAVSNLTGVPIHYYAETNYWGLQYMVDALGGIEMNLPFKVTLTHAWYSRNQGKTFAPGVQKLSGEMVTELCHERYSLPGTDYGRQQLQQAALIGIAKKVMQPSNVTRLPALSRSLSKFLIATNMSTEDMVSVGLGVKGDFHPEEQIKYRQVKGRGVKMYDDLLKANNSQIILDQTELQATIKKYFSN